MPTQAEISHQQELLRIQRSNLAQYLKQSALHGAAFVPPYIFNGIAEARSEIARIKAILLGWNAAVADHPDDTEVQASQAPSPPVVAAPLSRQRIVTILTDQFSFEELRTLCFDLNIDPENLPATTKATLARELVLYAEHRGRYPELVQHVQALRPNA